MIRTVTIKVAIVSPHPLISQHCSTFVPSDLFPRVAHVLEALVAFLRAVMVRDASGEDGDVPQPWVALLLLRLHLHAALSTALHHPTTAALGEMEGVTGK